MAISPLGAHIGKALSAELEEVTSRPTPVSVVYAALFLPYVIAYLVHLKGTRRLRIAILPMCMMAGVWTILGNNESMGPSESNVS